MSIASQRAKHYISDVVSVLGSNITFTCYSAHALPHQCSVIFVEDKLDLHLEIGDVQSQNVQSFKITQTALSIIYLSLKGTKHLCKQ